MQGEAEARWRREGGAVGDVERRDGRGDGERRERDAFGEDERAEVRFGEARDRAEAHGLELEAAERRGERQGRQLRRGVDLEGGQLCQRRGVELGEPVEVVEREVAEARGEREVPDKVRLFDQQRREGRWERRLAEVPVVEGDGGGRGQEQPAEEVAAALKDEVRDRPPEGRGGRRSCFRQ